MEHMMLRVCLPCASLGVPGIRRHHQVHGAEPMYVQTVALKGKEIDTPEIVPGSHYPIAHSSASLVQGSRQSDIPWRCALLHALAALFQI